MTGMTDREWLQRHGHIDEHGKTIRKDQGGDKEKSGDKKERGALSALFVCLIMLALVFAALKCIG